MGIISNISSFLKFSSMSIIRIILWERKDEDHGNFVLRCNVPEEKYAGLIKDETRDFDRRRKRCSPCAQDPRGGSADNLVAWGGENYSLRFW